MSEPLIVDTSAWIDYFRSGESSANAVRIESAIATKDLYLPVIVAAELLSGKLKEADRQAMENFLNDFPLIGTSRDHWYRVGRLRRHMAEHGTAVSTPDAHVAQSALEHNAFLLTGDIIFKRIADEFPLLVV